jgi:aspartate racemase
LKKLGLIGGIGPESTVAYYRQIVYGVQQRYGLQTLPPLMIESLSAFQVFAYCREQRFDDLTQYILNGIVNLVAGGAQLAALTGNTPNIVLDRVRKSSPIPIVSAIEASCNAAKQSGVKRIGLLGTVFTMTNQFFKTPFEQQGITVSVPNASQIAYIQAKIESELEHGIIVDETRQAFIEIIQDMQKHGQIEQIILGCTELPLLLSSATSPIPCLDTMQVHVGALIDEMCK